MEKLNKRISIVFAVLVAIFIGLSVFHSPVELFNHQECVIFRAGDDFMADFFNLQRYIADRDPYFNEVNTRSEHGYLPLSYLIVLPFNNLCDYAHMSLEDCWHSHIAVYSALVFLMISLFFFFDSLFRLNSKKGWRIYNTFLLLFTALFLHAIERGNEIFISAACINYFLAFYDADNVWKRRLGLFCLCFAAVLKIYPVLFGILLLQDKRYKDIVFCVVTGLLLAFVPFLCFKHGLANIPRLIGNLQVHTTTYSTIPSTEYKFGIHALCNGITYAVNYLQPGTIADSAVSSINSISKAITAVLSIITLILAFMERRRWLQVGLIAMVVMLYPFQSLYYTILYLLPMVVFFLGKEDCTKMDYSIAILLCLIMNPIQLVVPPVTLTPILANIFTIVLWILLLVHSTKGILKQHRA